MESGAAHLPVHRCQERKTTPHRWLEPRCKILRDAYTLTAQQLSSRHLSRSPSPSLSPSHRVPLSITLPFITQLSFATMSHYKRIAYGPHTYQTEDTRKYTRTLKDTEHVLSYDMVTKTMAVYHWYVSHITFSFRSSANRVLSVKAPTLRSWPPCRSSCYGDLLRSFPNPSAPLYLQKCSSLYFGAITCRSGHQMACGVCEEVTLPSRRVWILAYVAVGAPFSLIGP